MAISKDVLKQVIFDQHEIIKEKEIVERNYRFESQGNYILTGLRRAGKTTTLYKLVKDLIEKGVSWQEIIYLNFEDERLAEFTLDDFNEILLVQAELSDKKGYFFFDEIQNIDGWQKFARRLADSDERVYITGSNAKMLSKDMERALGGRYFSLYISPYNFREYLLAHNIEVNDNSLYSSKNLAKIKRLFDQYLQYGGFPETLKYENKREYVSNIYQKILLSDIVARNNIRNENSLKVLIKKIADTVCQPLSYSKLHNIIETVGFKLSKDTVIEYVQHAKDAYLIFNIKNYYAKFAEKESNPKYYFRDNGLLNLFLQDKRSALLENLIAIYLSQKEEELYYLQSSKTGIDIDFYLAEEKHAIQVTYSLDENSKEREINNLIKLADSDPETKLTILTFDQEEVIEKGDHTIEVIPAYKFILK